MSVYIPAYAEPVFIENDVFISPLTQNRHFDGLRISPTPVCRCFAQIPTNI